MNDVQEILPAVEDRRTLKARDIKIGPSGINFTNAGEVMSFARMMADSGFAVRPEFRNNPGACLAVIDDSIRFGMSPYFLARKAYLVNGQLAYEAQALAAVILTRAPIKDRPIYEYEGKGETRFCRVTVTLANGRVITHDSPPLAGITPKNSPLWKSDPDQQLGYYTVRALARRHFPDILGGAYDLEEAAAARAMDITPKTAPIAETLKGGEKPVVEYVTTAGAADRELAIDKALQDAAQKPVQADPPSQATTLATNPAATVLGHPDTPANGIPEDTHAQANPKPEDQGPSVEPQTPSGPDPGDAWPDGERQLLAAIAFDLAAVHDQAGLKNLETIFAPQIERASNRLKLEVSKRLMEKAQKLTAPKRKK